MSDERTCATCRWWEPVGYPRRPMRECLLFGDNRTSDMPEPLLFPFGGAGASREGIETLPGFGCVQWAAQAATTPEGGQ